MATPCHPPGAGARIQSALAEREGGRDGRDPPRPGDRDHGASGSRRLRRRRGDAGAEDGGHAEDAPAEIDAGPEIADEGGEAAAEEADAGEADGPEAVDPRFTPLVRAVEAELRSSRAWGAAVAALEDGVVTFAGGFGRKGPDDGAVEATTLFRIASCSKMLTATGVLQLVEEGAVDLEAPVTDYVPGYHFDRDATWAPSVTTQHLLSHTTGTVDYPELDAPPKEQTDAGLEEFLTGRFGWEAYLMVPPGTFYNYSNPGFMTLGLVAETVRDTTYRELMRDRVFAPVGMDRTFLLAEEVLADGDFAYGRINPALYPPEWGLTEATVAPDTYENPWARPAGYAWSSVLDLARFIDFLAHGDDDVLGDDQRTAMQSPQAWTHEVVDRDGEDYGAYGYGLLVARGVDLDDGHHDVPWIAHDGAIPGYSSIMFYFPEQEFGLVFLASGDGAYFPQSTSVALETLVALPDPVEMPDITPDPAAYPAMAGTYTDPFLLGEVLVTTDGDSLFVEIPSLDEEATDYDPRLTPASVDTFYLNASGSWLLVTFVPDDDGTYTWLRTRSFVAIRDTGGKRTVPLPPREARRPALERWLRTPQLRSPLTGP
jgi:CubicO group peptidase (beta-lactamase class C family)